MYDRPTVSIGLPVHNGATFLAEAIESILAQTFPGFELVISDNASTDRTPEICRSYAAADGRIRYYRQETNIGAAQNYNVVFQRSSGKYFKWAAHDDLIRPTFLARCVAALEADPEAVLCHSVVEIVGRRHARDLRPRRLRHRPTAPVRSAGGAPARPPLHRGVRGDPPGRAARYRRSPITSARIERC